MSTIKPLKISGHALLLVLIPPFWYERDNIAHFISFPIEQ